MEKIKTNKTNQDFSIVKSFNLICFHTPPKYSPQTDNANTLTNSMLLLSFGTKLIDDDT